MKRDHSNIKDNNYENFYQWRDWGEEIDLRVYDQGNWVAIETFLNSRV